MPKQVHARFSLYQVNRGTGWFKATSEEEAKPVESAQITLNATQGEPFGAYTPSGKLEMFIVNPAAAQMFFDAPIGQEFDILISPVAPAE